MEKYTIGTKTVGMEFGNGFVAKTEMYAGFRIAEAVGVKEVHSYANTMFCNCVDKTDSYTWVELISVLATRYLDWVKESELKSTKKDSSYLKFCEKMKEEYFYLFRQCLAIGLEKTPEENKHFIESWYEVA